MNRWLARTAFAGCVVAAASWPLFAQPKVEVVPQPTSESQTIAVVGEATTQVRPDTAILTFGVEIRNPNTTQAVLVNERMTKKIVAEIEKAGTKSADIAVGSYRMEHVVNTFIPALGTNQAVEFHVEQHGTYKVTTKIVVTVHDLATVANLFNVALIAGVDRIGPVEYVSSRLEEIEAQLIPGAIKNARKKAEVLARDCGLQLGEPLNVTEVPNTSASVKILGGNPAAGETAPPVLQVRQRVRVVYAATKASD